MSYPVRALLWAAASCLPACGISVNYDDTEYRCDQSGTCPDGYRCDDGVCVDQDGEPDEKPDAAVFDRPDADDGDTIFMLSESSEPEIAIPDDFEQGVIDAIAFDTPCEVVDVMVDVEIYHEWRGDLFIELTGPSQTEVDLKDPGEDPTQNLIGTYPTTLTPDEDLGAFVGEEGAGAWILRVADVGDNDVGIFDTWAVHLWCR